jgi:hypothetical protein
VQKTLVLLNNFTVTTADYLNAFSDTVEKKISKVSNRITDLETLLAVLEAKLNSVPDLDAASDRSSTHNNPSSAVQQPISSSSGAPDRRMEDPSVVDVPPSSSQQRVPVSEHPSYVQFFTLLKVGVPSFVVQAKISAAGLDPSMVDTPDLLVSL